MIRHGRVGRMRALNHRTKDDIESVHERVLEYTRAPLCTPFGNDLSITMRY